MKSKSANAHAQSAKTKKQEAPASSVQEMQPKSPELLRFGKDEMNLAEHPFALVRYGDTAGSVIEYEWDRRLPSGRVVKASWRVSGDAALGLPGPSDECLYLVLMELTRESGFQQTVSFSRYDLIQRLGWSRSSDSYKLLSDCFTRLKAVSIRAQNCFWDAGQKSPRAQVGFSILDNYDIAVEPPGKKNKERQLPLSWFKWNDEVYASICAGNVRDLAIGFALSLRNPTARRLFRYLDMHRYERASYQVGLEKLRDHLGLVGLDYASKIKERLKPAHDELTERGFLEKVNYLPMRSKSGEKVVYSFGNLLLPAGESVAIEAPKHKSIEEKDSAVIMDAAARILDELPEQERAVLHEEACRGWAPFVLDRLNDPTSVVAQQHRKMMCQLVERDYPELVAAELRKDIKPG